MPKQDLRISVVTPSLNQANFLAATLRSLLQQDYPQLEYLVIDGGSSDGSVEIIRRYAAHLAYWVSESDAGQAAALNRGFRRATGHILGWVNSDDLLAPGALRRVANVFAEHPQLAWCTGDCRYIDAAGRKGQIISLLPDTGLVSWLTHLKYGQGIFVQPSTFWRASAMHELGPLREDLHYAFDFQFFYQLRKRFGPPIKIDAVLSEFRLHDASKSVTASDRFLLEMLLIVRDELGQLSGAERAAVQAWLDDERVTECFLQQQRALAGGDRFGHWQWRMRGWAHRLRRLR